VVNGITHRRYIKNRYIKRSRLAPSVAAAVLRPGIRDRTTVFRFGRSADFGIAFSSEPYAEERFW
ncbi:MAG: hypothetical protein PUA50_00375, partial [Eubacteriales bacterium]|nr:hypothetical protein [Eubacteriales bacterium]